MPHKEGYITAQHDENFQSIRFYFPIEVDEKFNVLSIKRGEKFTAASALDFTETLGVTHHISPKEMAVIMSSDSDVDGYATLIRLHINSAACLMLALSLINEHHRSIERKLHMSFFLQP